MSARRVLVAATLVFVLGAAGGCKASAPAVAAKPHVAVRSEVTTPTQVREIPEVANISAVPGGPMVVESYPAGPDGGLRLCPTWDSTRATRLGGSVVDSGKGSMFSADGPSNPSATRNGVYFDAGGRLYFQGYSARQPSDLGLRHVSRVWASPSGRRLLVELASGVAIFDVGSQLAQLPGDWKVRPLGDAVWTSDDHFVMEVDTPTDGGFGEVFGVTVDSRGHTSRTRLIADPMSCPAPNPADGTWAWVDTDSGQVVLSRPGSQVPIATWRAKDWDESAQVSGPPVWLDRTHLAVVGGTERASAYTIDFSSVLHR